MRSTACGLITLQLLATTGAVAASGALAGCGGWRAQSAVVTGWNRTRVFSEEKPSTVQYSGHAMVPAPIIPVLPFGAAFDLAVVVETGKEDGKTYHFARSGSQWFALETDPRDGEQTLISNLATLDAWAPELPVRRKVDPNFKVVDRSTADELEFTITYANADNEDVEATLMGDPPYRFQKKRNADPEGALRQSALPLIDMAHQESLFKASLKVNDRSVGVKRSGLVPQQISAELVTAGLAVGGFTVVGGDVRPLGSSWKAPRIITPEVELPPAAPAPAPAAPDPLKLAMQTGLADLQGCWTAAAKPELEGRILLAWKVAEGKGSDVQAVLDTVANEGLTNCIKEKVAGWTYAPEITGDVGYPITVVKGEGVKLEEAPPPAPEAAPAPAPAEAGTGAGDGSKTVTGERGKPEEKPAEDLPEAKDDLLGDDAEAKPAVPTIVYNGLADFMSSHTMRSGNTVELEWKVEHAGDRVYARQVNPERTLQYEFLVNYDSLELADISVYQSGRPVPVVHVDINPAIPDLRRPFSGRAESSYVIDVNGQDGYATGRVEAWWSEGGPKVTFIPDAPEWNTDGRLSTTVVLRQGGSDISIRKGGE